MQVTLESSAMILDMAEFKYRYVDDTAYQANRMLMVLMVKSRLNAGLARATTCGATLLKLL